MLFLAVIICLGVNEQFVEAGSWNDTKTLLDDLMAKYDTDIRPVGNQSEPITVDVQLFIKSIQEFEEVKELFSFVGALLIMWKDVNMQWDPALYGGVSEVTVSYESVWVPELILSSPSDDVECIGKKWNRVRFDSEGQATWFPVDLIKSTCFVNVYNYPFDTQYCVTSFNSVGYNINELVIRPLTSTVDTSIYQENTLWDLIDTTVHAKDSGAGSQIDFTFHLKRKPSFVIINVLLPLLFLSMLNVFVFLLVPESGERASYCITVLLSIAVFMTIVSAMLPRSSQPVPVISYKLMVDMASSSLIVLVTLLNLRIYSRDVKDPVPEWLKAIYKVLSCANIGRPKIQPGDNSLSTYIPKSGDGDKLKELKTLGTVPIIEVKPVEPRNTGQVREKLATLIPVTKEIMKRNKVTWKKISYMLDRIALIFFSLLSLISFFAFIAITSLHDD